MVDLHIHSIFSDGAYSINEILKLAQDSGCTIISIVDHNTCEAYDYLEKMKVKLFKGKIISGCEFNTFYNHIPIELLGYDFNPKLLKEELKELYKYSALELENIEKELFINQCELIGVKLALNRYQKEKKERISTYLHRCLTYYPENVRYFSTREDFENPQVFYRNYISNPNTVFFLDMEKFYPTPQEVANAVKRTGGKVFIPHIFEYRSNAKEILLGLMNSIHIDGIECFYSKFTPEQRNVLSKFAEKHGLLKSGGSDCHSGKHIAIGVGKGDLNISLDMLKGWINFAKNFNLEREENER